MGAVIRANRFSIELNREAVRTDVAEFERALAEAGRARSDTMRVDRLTAALELYSGPLLPGHYQDWVIAEQDRLAELHFQATESLVGILGSVGELGEALRHARRAVTIDPLREGAHVLVMRLLAGMGQSAAVHRQYRELERILREELDEAPSDAARHWADGVPDTLGPPGAGRARRVSTRRVAATASAGVPLAGTVTVLLCGIDEPTAEEDGEAVSSAQATSRGALREEVRRHGGSEVRTLAGEFVAVFARATDALASAVAGQQAVRARSGDRAPALVRMVLHTCEVDPSGHDPCGEALRPASRLLAAGHAGQILLGETTCSLLRQHQDPSVMLTDLGR
jgi:class 3 adenylate cyclase